ncbi:alpha/beta hydrolase [Nocardia sp. NPDC050406]|uniref:alpha/beta hydrolase n=1 Tax=Nocardia sp. NPDC050406 TaxID=3364318 RepID=UPI0037AC4A8A
MSTPANELLPVWPDSPAPHQDPRPYGQFTSIPEVQGHHDLRVYRNVTRPALAVHRPERPNGAAVILCPGGSFVTLTDSSTDIAKSLAAQGVTALVLRYRLLPTPVDDAEFLSHWGDYTEKDRIAQSRSAARDAIDAVRTVRGRAAELEIAEDRIGILGFSAGGLLAATAATGYDADSRPDFAASLYGAAWHDHTVPADAPPLFLCFAADDEGPGVVAGNLTLHRDWLAAGRSVEMHVYAQGRHGFAEGPRGLPCDTWLDRYLDWMRALAALRA